MIVYYRDCNLLFNTSLNKIDSNNNRNNIIAINYKVDMNNSIIK